MVTSSPILPSQKSYETARLLTIPHFSSPRRVSISQPFDELRAELERRAALGLIPNIVVAASTSSVPDVYSESSSSGPGLTSYKSKSSGLTQVLGGNELSGLGEASDTSSSIGLKQKTSLTLSPLYLSPIQSRELIVELRKIAEMIKYFNKDDTLTVSEANALSEGLLLIDESVKRNEENMNEEAHEFKMKKKDLELVAKDRTIASRDGDIEDKDREINERNSELEDRNRELKERESEIQDCNRKIKAMAVEMERLVALVNGGGKIIPRID